MQKHLLRIACTLLLCLATNSVKALTAHFTATDTAGCTPLSVVFHSTNVGVSHYHWNIPSSDTPTVGKVFTSPGTYPIILTVDSAGYTSSDTMMITVYPNPTVAFSVPDTSVCPGTPIVFTNSSAAGIGTFTSRWIFSDGSSDTATAPSHTYTREGFYNITLKITNSKGCYTEVTLDSFIHIFGRPTVTFTASDTFFCRPPATVLFTDTVSGASPFSHQWDFGDGGTSSSHNPLHTYTYTGSRTVTFKVSDLNGCRDSLTKLNYITVDSVHARLIVQDTLCLNDSLSVMDSSSAYTYTNLSWGDGASVIRTTPVYTYTHLYTTSGIKTLTLVKTNSRGCSDTAIYHVYVRPAPAVNFSMLPLHPCPAPSTITVQDSVAAGSTVGWDFGDGTYLAGDTVSHTYTYSALDTVIFGYIHTYKIKTITMYVQDIYGCETKKAKNDTIYNLFFDIVPDSPTTGCRRLVCFHTTAKTNVPYLATPVTYPYLAGATHSWNFGDGGTSHVAAPCHNYTDTGIFIVRDTMTTSDGCIAIDTQIIKVGLAPKVEITHGGHVCYRDSMLLEATLIRGPVDKYYWTFQDSSTFYDTMKTTTTRYHFPLPGIYTATLTASYYGCFSDTPDIMIDSFIVDSPMARINITYSCLHPYNVFFRDSSYGADTHRWIFNDGTSSTSDTVTHIYPPIHALTTYTVSLTTYDSVSGCRDTARASVEVLDPFPTFALTDSTLCPYQTTTMNRDSSYLSYVKYDWYDGSSLWFQQTNFYSFNFSFPFPATRVIKGVFKDKHGCYDTSVFHILITHPVSHFVTSPLSGCSPLDVHFTDTSISSAGTILANYRWKFGDGATDSVITDTISHLFTSFAIMGHDTTFRVVEIVTDTVGCSDSSSVDIRVFHPHARFTVDTPYHCIGDSIAFHNVSLTTVSGSSYMWLFGDGTSVTTASTAIIKHAYPATTNYTARLIVIDSMGCTDTFSRIIHIVKPTARFSMTDSVFACRPATVAFHDSSINAVSILWYPGNSSPSSIPNPVFSYDTGIYHPYLVATDVYGCHDTAYASVNVLGHSGSFFYPFQLCKDDSVLFTSPTSHIDSIIWEFNDGSLPTSGSLADTSLRHQYTLPGTFVPLLILIRNSSGDRCSNTITGTDTVKVDTVGARFVVSPNPVCLNDTITFIDTSTSYFSHIVSHRWKFTSTDSANRDTAYYVYHTRGAHAVMLIASDAWGCKDTARDTARVFLNLLTVSGDDTICIGDSTRLVAAGDSTYHWSPATGLGCTTCDTVYAHPAVTTTYTVTGISVHGCPDTAEIKVVVKQLPVVDTITGIDSVCVYSTTHFYDSTSGGSWVSFDTAIATTDTNGVITGVRAGLDTIYYRVTNDCGTKQVKRIVRVMPLPAVIQNTSGICIGDTITVTDSISGGKWTSSNTTIATIDSVTGHIHGLSNGTVTITYLLPSGCYRTASFPVFALPTLAGISGPDSVCVGNNITLIDTPSGGIWSCTNAHASIDTAGVLTGVSNGIDTVYYSFTGAHGCSVRDTYLVQVDTFPYVDSFYFKDTICTYDSTMLYFPSTLVWTNFVSSNPAIARIDSYGTYYYLVGLSPGLDTISYTINNHGCITTRMDTIRIMPPPHLGPIGPDTVCVGSTILLHDSTGVGAGSWSAHDSAYLVIDTLTGALVTGIGVGTAIVTFTSSPNGYECWNYVYDTIHVLAPPVIPAITGIDSLCLGSPAVFLFDSLTGGRWTSSTTGVATIDSLTGEVSGLDTGRTIITYTTIDRLGCISRVTDTFRVDSLPYVHLIVMKDSVCPHDSVLLDTSMHGGWWSSSDAGIAFIDSATGFVIGVSPGTVTLTYTVVNAFGCVGIATIPFTVLTPPFAGAITGPDTLCIGLTSIYTSSSGTSAAYWATSDTLVARVDTGAAFGTIVGVGAGTAIISFILTSNAGCTSSATKIVTVIPVIISPIIGPSSLCVGTTFTYTNAITGGMWSSPDLNISVNPVTGDVTGLSAGPATISYTYTTVCGPTTVILPITVDPMPEPIVGVIALCSPDSALFTDAVPGGSWSTSNSAIASVDPVTGWVYGIASGTAYITYTLVNACGTNDVVTAVTINMLPYIVTNFVVACQTLAVDTTGRGQGSGGYNGNGHNYVLTDSSGCIMVCDSTVVRYYGRGVLGSHFTWGISGGSILAYYGANNDSVDVIWPTAGVTGYIEVFDTFSHCIGDYRVCIKVISRPHALFTSSAVSICRDEQVCFNDLSTGDATSPIVYWHWDFGDGTGSTVHSPCHTFTAPGTYMVTLTVKNRCNCTSTYQIPIEVQWEPGMHIDCAGAACENETATYTLSGGSAATVWSVIGGHMIPTMPANTIRVKWDAVGADGYGYVSAYDPLSSALCRDTTTIRVPIILDSATIQGPSTACVGQQYEYSLPLWGSTDYRWGVLGKPGLIVGYNDDYKMTVIFDTPGVYRLHAKYQNRIKLCGGNVFKTVTVLPPVNIQGPKIFCQYTTQTWFLSTTARWELVDPTGNVIDIISSASTYTYTFTMAGIYTLKATGAFCADPLSLTVMPAPPPVDSVKGPDTVCRGRVYTYNAYADMPGTTYHWTATGGTVTPADGSPTVNVTWTGSGAKSLSVSRQSVFDPYCDGTPTVITIIDEPITPNISGNATPCANSLQGYNGNYYKGDTYEWSIFPDSCGSVVGGNHGMNANILWNNVVSSPTAAIVLKVQKCDSVVTDTFYAVVQPSPAMTITPSLFPACSKVPVMFTAAAGDSAYVWNFGDGSPLVTTTTNTVIHIFPPNYTSLNAGYSVVVTAILGVSTGCPPIGSATFNMTILPGPLAFNSTASPYNPCPMTANVTYVGTVTSNVGTITYQWFDPSFVSGATGSTYSSTADGAFYFIATGANGCADTSNYVVVNHRDCPTGGGGTGSSGSGSGGGSTGTGATTGCLTGHASHTCTDITVIGSPGGGQWFLVNPSSYPYAFTAGMDTVNIGFSAPGIYVFMYVNGTSCPHDTIYVADTIPLVPDFRYSIKCGPGNTDSVILYDHSTYLPWISITSSIFVGVATGGTGAVVGIDEPAPFTDTINHTVWYTGAGGPWACTMLKIINIPAKPHVWFTDTLTPICEGVPVAFTPYSSGSILSCLWKFGDSATSLLQYTKRTYSHGASNPFDYSAKLIVTDSIGCVADSTENVRIFTNELFGQMDFHLFTLCKGDFPFAVNYINGSGAPTPIRYIWSTGDTTGTPTINTDTAGAYWVTIYDTHQCQFTVPWAENLSMVKVPEARIFGRHRYCVGDDVKLSGYAGSGTGYQWILHDTATVGTDPTLTVHGLGAGVHHIQLITSATENGVTCYDTSDLDSFFVYGLPAPPVITGPTVIDCGMYHLQLTATSTAPGDFNWQDGTFTSSSFSSVDNIYSGGPYKVWFTDVNGCISHADTIVPLSPDYYFQYLMQGCYTLCGGQLPLTLNGPPHVTFNYWEWLMGGAMVTNGSGSAMAPYTITEPNDYAWTLDNGLCSATSGILHIDTIDCNSCEQTTFSCVFTCDSSRPARYTGVLTMTNYLLDRAFTIGTDGGPVTPFTGGLPMGAVVLNFNFTVIDTNATSVTFTFIITDTLTGAKCYQKVTVALPDCHWIREKTIPGTDKGEGKLADALLVYPNPASQEVNISYDYGSRTYGQRNLSIYDALGRKVGNLDAPDAQGKWHVDTKDFVPGMYVIRMEGDGKTLQMQKLVVSN